MLQSSSELENLPERSGCSIEMRGKEGERMFVNNGLRLAPADCVDAVATRSNGVSMREIIGDKGI